MHLLLIGYGDLKVKLQSYGSELNIKSISFFRPVFDINEKSYIFNEIVDIGVVPSIITKRVQQEGGQW